jgi:hypothetical protein
MLLIITAASSLVPHTKTPQYPRAWTVSLPSPMKACTTRKRVRSGPSLILELTNTFQLRPCKHSNMTAVSISYSMFRRVSPTSLPRHSFRIIYQGQEGYVGGTSCSPTFYSFVSMLNDARITAGKLPLGFLNQLFKARLSRLYGILRYCTFGTKSKYLNILSLHQ